MRTIHLVFISFFLFFSCKEKGTANKGANTSGKTGTDADKSVVVISAKRLPASHTDSNGNISNTQNYVYEPDIMSIPKEGYLELMTLCHVHKKKQQLIDFINGLKPYGDQDHVTTLGFLINYLANNKIHFIRALDWKWPPSELDGTVRLCLKDNFNLTIPLPGPGKYPVNSTISTTTAFRDYDKALKAKGFRLGLIDTDGDEYVVIIFKIVDEEKVIEAVRKIGFPYHNVYHRSMPGYIAVE
jgi:hypothetical protein